MSQLQAKKDPLSDWDNMPISHARIGYENLLTQTGDMETDKALTRNTYERWEDASGTMEGLFQTATPQKMDFIAIGAHSLKTSGATDVLIQYTQSAGSSYVDIESVSIIDDNPIMLLLDEQIEDVEEIKIIVNGGTDREIGYVSAGVALQMFMPIYGGHTPADLAGITEFQATESESGQFLAREIIRKGVATSYQWQHLNDIWVRERFMPFVESARKYPFFMQWRPDRYDAAIFCWTPVDIQPTNMGGGSRLMSVSFSIKGHRDAKKQ